MERRKRRREEEEEEEGSKNGLSTDRGACVPLVGCINGIHVQCRHPLCRRVDSGSGEIIDSTYICFSPMRAVQEWVRARQGPAPCAHGHSVFAGDVCAPRCQLDRGLHLPPGFCFRQSLCPMYCTFDRHPFTTSRTVCAREGYRCKVIAATYAPFVQGT